MIQKENILSGKPVDILSFDSIFLETDIGHGLIFKSKRSGITHKFTMIDIYIFKNISSKQGSRLNNTHQSIAFNFGGNNNYHQIGNAYLQ